MTSVSSENWEFLVDEIDFEGMEVSEMDETLLMALLDESNVVEEAEEERLGSVMKSLEAEIDPKTIMGFSNSDDGSQECSASSSESSPSHGMESFDWINDMEMDSSVSSSTNSDDDEMGINNWYMDTSFTNEIDAGMIEFGGFRDYESQLYYGVHQLDQEQGSYSSSLWQETYTS